MKSAPTQTTIAIATAIAISTTYAGDSGAVDSLLSNLKSKDDKVRGPAWQGAGTEGAPAVKPLAALMSDAEFETARSAKRALHKIVRHAARPGAATEARTVEKELIASLAGQPVQVRRDLLWMLSEIGGDDTITAIAPLLNDAELREDARCVLLRVPGKKSTAALQKAFASAPEEFKFALADALRERGEKVTGYPTQRMVPVKKTSVTPKGTV